MRIRTLILTLFAVIAVSAVASASASAASCYKVKEAGTGNYKKQNAITGLCEEGPVAGREFIEVEKVEKDLGSGVLCAKVKEAGTGNYATLATCEAGTTRVAGSPYIRVLENANEQQQFKLPAPNGCSEKAGGQGSFETKAACEAGTPETTGGKWHQHRGFTSKEAISTLRVSGASVECKKDTDAGKIDAQWNESVEKVVVTFVECKEPTNGCEVKSAGATHNNEIVTKPLKGELGEVPANQAASEVGLLLEGEASNVFVTLEGTCLPAGGGAVEGSVVGEVTPVGPPSALTDKAEFLLSAGAQQIKTFERSFAKHCTGAPAARKCTEDFSFGPKLEAFTKAATFESKDENEFEELVEVLKGV